MRKELLFVMLIWNVAVLSQPATNGFMRGKYNLDFAPSVSYETYGSYFSKLNHKVSVSRVSIPVSLYAAYGITDWLDVQANIPYVYTVEELSGMQDFSLNFKGKILDKTIAEDNIKLMVSIGGKIPMTQYITQSVNAIGQADTAVDLRLVFQYTTSGGFFVMTQVGYTYRLDPVPSSYPFALAVGWAKEKYYFDLWYDQQWALGGNDYQDWRDIDRTFSFRSFGVSYGKVGITYYRPVGKSSGFSTGLSYVLWGRNVGQAVIASVGYVHRFKFKAE